MNIKSIRLDSNNIKFMEFIFKDFTSKTLSDIFHDICSNEDYYFDENIIKFIPESVIFEFLKTENILIKGVKEVLKELSKDYKMGIVTTSRRVDFEIIHKNLGIVDFMDFVLCEEDYEFAKPHPQPYLKGLEIFGANKDEAIVIEDSTRGLTSAYKAGIECVIVKNEFTITQDFSKATYFINTLEELKTILS